MRGEDRRIVLLDFDGTLADSFPRAVALLPRLARELSFRAPEPEDLEALRELTTREILKRLEIAWWKVPFLLWRARMLLDRDPRPLPFFPGMADLLHWLDASGTEWGILTTNGLDLVRRTLRQAKAPEPGWLEAGAGLGKARRLRAMASRLGVRPDRIVLVGDESRDLEAAREAGTEFVAVAWGYGTAASLQRAGAEEVALDAAQLQRMLETRLTGTVTLGGLREG